jgi:Acetyltransferase (GNAT) family
MGELEVSPLTPERWGDFAEFFSNQQPAARCWCMWWRSAGRDIAPKDADGREGRAALKRLVDNERSPGLVAYLRGKAIGWCSVGARDEYKRLQYTPAQQPWSAQPVWSIVCFFVDEAHLESGVEEALLAAAVVHARAQGARTLECYPAERGPHRAMAAQFAGPRTIYLRAAGFHEGERRYPAQPPAPGPAGRYRGVWQGERPLEHPVLRADLDPSTPAPDLTKN